MSAKLAKTVRVVSFCSIEMLRGEEQSVCADAENVPVCNMSRHDKCIPGRINFQPQTMMTVYRQGNFVEIVCDVRSCSSKKLEVRQASKQTKLDSEGTLVYIELENNTGSAGYKSKVTISSSRNFASQQ